MKILLMAKRKAKADREESKSRSKLQSCPVSSLRAKVKKYGGEKGKNVIHWCANMKVRKKEIMSQYLLT